MVIQGTLLSAVHEQPLAALTLTLAEPPDAPMLCAVGCTSNAHPGDCVTVNTCPAITAVPVRSGPCVGATLNATGPGPAPVDGLTVIHGTLLAAVHGHAAAAATRTLPALPAAAAAWDVVLIAYVQP
jgi:hypothetical protein